MHLTNAKKICDEMIGKFHFQRFETKYRAGPNFTIFKITENKTGKAKEIHLPPIIPVLTSETDAESVNVINPDRLELYYREKMKAAESINDVSVAITDISS